MMRAAVLDSPRMVRIDDVAHPRPGDGQVLVRVDGCGLCGSDLAVWQGRPWFEYPREPGAPGHEVWGTVEALGHGADPALEGRRVATLSSNGLAELDVADAAALVTIPDSIRSPFPAEAVACAMNVFARSGIEADTTVAVVGVGFMGALLVQLAAARGSHVIAVSRRRFALDVALQAGAKHALKLDDDTDRAVRELVGEQGCDVVIEATGHQSALDVAGELVRVRGRLVVAGYHQDGTRTVNMQSWNWRGIDVINAHEREPAVYVRGMRAAVQAVSDGTIDLGPLVTHQIALADAGSAFELADARPDGFLKAVVVP